jgi:hypothetical protein
LVLPYPNSVQVLGVEQRTVHCTRLTVFRYSVQVQCTGTVYRYSVQVQCTDTVYRHNVQVQCTGTEYRYRVQVQSTGTEYTVQIQCTNCQQRSKTFALFSEKKTLAKRSTPLKKLHQPIQCVHNSPGRCPGPGPRDSRLQAHLVLHLHQDSRV